MSTETRLVLLTRGQSIECPNPVLRPAIKPVHDAKRKRPITPGNIVADFPRRWKLARGCKVATPAGGFTVTATPRRGGMIRIDSKRIDEITAALGLTP